MIVSGGIYAIIDHSMRMLERHELSGPDEAPHDFSFINILSNKFEFDNKGIVCGYEVPLIHSANKREVIYDELDMVLRRNIIVMGDIIEDSFMVRESHHDTILRIGFLNKLELEKKELIAFKNTFDLIIGGDGSFCPIITSLEALFNNKDEEELTLDESIVGSDSLLKVLR